jgi:hypothetical protein
MKKENLPLLFENDTSSLVHTSFSPDRPHAGWLRNGPSLQQEFTIHALIRPADHQVRDATVLEMVKNVNGVRGFLFREADTTTHQYMFAIGTGSATMSFITFPLKPGTWNEVKIRVTPVSLQAYLSGEMVAQTTLPLPYVNAETTLTIGNNQTRTAEFNGYIRELFISGKAAANQENKQPAIRLANLPEAP